MLIAWFNQPTIGEYARNFIILQRQYYIITSMSITILSILVLMLTILCAWLLRSNASLRDSATRLSVDKATAEQQLVASRARCVTTPAAI